MTIIWHNPRCSKSRAALAILEQRGEDITIRRYLEDTPDTSEIRHVMQLLGVSAINMMRTGEAAFSEFELSSETAEDRLIAAMSEAPILIERPIVIKDGKAVIGRPPEAIIDLL